MSSQTAPNPPEPLGTVAVAVMAESAERLRDCLAAVGRQVYAPSQVFVVGGDQAVRAAADESSAHWRPRLPAVLEALDPGTVFVWLLTDRSRPRPDALEALVRDGSRVDASVAGSKVLDAADPAVLVSVGYATDVFDAPYSGLQPGELDQQQYDVIRDVAAVSARSMLVRLDLLRGLGGLDATMGPVSASIDFCQRARLRGGRVVAVPSSEVFYEGRESSPHWRERAGEIRAMIKVYSPITLLWALPLAFLSGLVESITGPFVGRWPLFGFLAGWLRALVGLPTALLARWRARRFRVVGDEELFRYQTGGSARLKKLYDSGLERLRSRFPQGVLSGFSGAFEAGQERLRRPAVVVGLAVTAFALVATRSIWLGHLPVVGFSLPAPESAPATLGAYAGGWNPAGLGSPEVLRPEVAATALVQAVLFGKGGLAVAVLTVAAFLGGVFGTARLLRLWGIGSVPGYLAGTVLMAGPAVPVLAADGSWSMVVALGAVPWAALAALAPWPRGPLRRIGRLAGAALAAGLVGAFAPAALVLPAAAVLLWALVGRGRRWPAVVVALLGAAAAIPLLMPWVLYADLGGLLTSGTASFWQPGWLAAVAAGAFLLVVLGGDRATSAVAGWGAVLAALGLLVARAGDFGVGRDAGGAGLMAAALGMAAITGAALEAGARRRRVGGVPGVAGLLAALAALALVGSTIVPGMAGRAALPEDRYTGLLGFAWAGEQAPSRVLLFGAHEDLPGTSRDLAGLGYRLINPPDLRSWDAYLPEPRLGDEALHDLLERLLEGDVRRAGERLAAFGIGWVSFLDPSPLERVFEAQLDMVPLRGLELPTYRNEVASGIAVGATGDWEVAGAGFTRTGDGDDTVYLALNADYRWGPGEWAQAGWANQVRTDATELRFAPNPTRRNLAIGAAAWLGLLMVATAVGWWAPRKEER